jgi:hypothetical protein
MFILPQPMIRTILFPFLLSSMAFSVAAQKDSAYSQPLITSALKQRLSRTSPEDSIDLLLVTSNPKQLQKWGARILYYYAPANSVQVRIKAKEAPALFSSRVVGLADLVLPPKEELTTGSLDMMTNYVNYAHRIYPTLRGDSILTSIKERSFDTTDIDYAHRYKHTATPATTVTAHASIMATTIAGAANSSPYAQGVADRSLVTSSDFASLLPDPDTFFQRHRITVQNHSYGTEIQNYYGVEAAAYDVSARNNPSLLHVFSSGNQGTRAASSGAYAGIEGMANLVGNFKMAKNILTVGAIDSFYNVSPLSSKGPAYDGRVKPELVAFGEDGSSGAAAMVSGSAVLVQQAYKRQHNQSASSALVKAVLVNSADDVGVPAVDFSSGYGSLNTYQAVKTVLENRVLEDAVGNAATKSFSVTVPANAAQLKVSLAWTDPAADPNAVSALINDLDLVVKQAASGQQWLPWVLNTKSHKDSLLLPAQRGRDTLNNMEQVTIDFPAAGIYTIEVKGMRLQTAVQSFALSYSVDTLNTFFWTYPTAIHGIEGGKVNNIRWVSNSNAPGTIEFSANGTTWQEVATVPNLKVPYYKWNAPDTFSTGLLRLRLAAREAITDTFVISKATHLNTGFNCADSFMLFWNALPVNQYQLYTMNGGYLQPFSATPDTFAILSKAQNPSPYFSVAPLVNGKPGQRSFILNYGAQGTECFLKSFYLQAQDFFAATFTATLGSVYNVSAVSLQKLRAGQYVMVRTVPAPDVTTFSFTDSSLTRGVNQFRLQIRLSSGQIIYSNEVSVFHFVHGEVIVYPNPVRQQDPVNIITSMGGRVTIQVYNESGVMVYTQKLTNLSQQIPPHLLSKGLYIIKVISDDGQTSHQKLLVL